MKNRRQHIAFRSIMGIIVLLVLFSAIVSVIGYNAFTEALLSQYAGGAFLTADSAAQILDVDRMDEYVNSGGTTLEYWGVWDQMDRLCNSSGSTFIYVIQPDLTDYAHITFIFSTIDHTSTYTKYAFGFVRDTTNNEYRTKYRALYEKESERELVLRDKGYIETGSHLTAMIPLIDSRGDVRAILCVQRQMDVLTNVRRTYIKKIAVVLVSLVLLVIVGQSLFLHRAVLRPLKLITDEAARFSAEGEKTEKKLRDRIHRVDEIGQLAVSIDRMEEQIQDYIENITRITADRERISTELSLAGRIQEAMLPSHFPAFPDRTEFDLYASMDPAKEVGGDFYDFFLIDDDHLCMVMADVSGKGIPAALFMMASRIILANNANSGKSPARILTDTNSVICAKNRAEMFVTVWLGILEISTGKLTASNAGHEYPVLKHPDGDFELRKDKHGLVIGGMSGIQYREYEIQLEPGSRLFLYTDGVPEATDAQNELFGTDRMLAALNRSKNASPEQILKDVRQAVDHFVKEAEQFDDLTMLCLEYRGCEIEKKTTEEAKL